MHVCIKRDRDREHCEWILAQLPDGSHWGPQCSNPPCITASGKMSLSDLMGSRSWGPFTSDFTSWSHQSNFLYLIKFVRTEYKWTRVLHSESLASGPRVIIYHSEGLLWEAVICRMRWGPLWGSITGWHCKVWMSMGRGGTEKNGHEQ